MKTLVLKSFGHGNFYHGTLSKGGIAEAQEFGEALKAMFPSRLKIGFFSAHAHICQRTAEEIAGAMGRKRRVSPLKSLGRRAGYVDHVGNGQVKGLGQCLPDEFDVAVCVTNPDVMERYRKQMGDCNTDTSLREPHSAQIHPFPNGRWVG